MPGHEGRIVEATHTQVIVISRGSWAALIELLILIGSFASRTRRGCMTETIDIENGFIRRDPSYLGHRQ